VSLLGAKKKAEQEEPARSAHHPLDPVPEDGLSVEAFCLVNDQGAYHLVKLRLPTKVIEKDAGYIASMKGPHDLGVIAGLIDNWLRRKAVGL